MNVYNRTLAHNGASPVASTEPPTTKEDSREDLKHRVGPPVSTNNVPLEGLACETDQCRCGVAIKAANIDN